MTKTVVFIPGAFMTAASWDSFRKPFEEAGYSVVAPNWPMMDRSVDELRNGTSKAFGKMPLGAIVRHYEDIVRSLEAPPLLVGHSFGGLVVQLLLDRGFGAAGVAISPAPIGGVIPGPTSLAAAFPVIARWNGWNRAFMPGREAFDRTFANTASLALRADTYTRLVVPAPGRIFYEAAASIGTFVSPKKRAVPLLLISAQKDRTITPFVVRATYLKQRRSTALTTLKNFDGRSHFLIAEPGWEEVAQYALHWAQSLVLLPLRGSSPVAAHLLMARG